MSTPLLHLLAGPNGAGKTTLYERALAYTHLPFVSADLIAASRWPQDQAAHAYEASRLAATARDDLLESRTSFITETVFSHPSKLDLITQASERGYQVHLHVVAIPLELALARVPSRVAHGGHDVPAAKIRDRYARLWPLLAQAIAGSDMATVYDNSSARRPLRVVAAYRAGAMLRTPDWPVWMPAELIAPGG